VGALFAGRASASELSPEHVESAGRCRQAHNPLAWQREGSRRKGSGGGRVSTLTVCSSKWRQRSRFVRLVLRLFAATVLVRGPQARGEL
jgi:hypothetical protein